MVGNLLAVGGVHPPCGQSSRLDSRHHFSLETGLKLKYINKSIKKKDITTNAYIATLVTKSTKKIVPYIVKGFAKEEL